MSSPYWYCRKDLLVNVRNFIVCYGSKRFAPYASLASLDGD